MDKVSLTDKFRVRVNDMTFLDSIGRVFLASVNGLGIPVYAGDGLGEFLQVEPMSVEALREEVLNAANKLVEARKIWAETLLEFSQRADKSKASVFDFSNLVRDRNSWLRWRKVRESLIKTKPGLWYEFQKELSNRIYLGNLGGKGSGPYPGQINIFEHGTLVVSKPGMGKTRTITSSVQEVLFGGKEIAFVPLSLSTITTDELFTSVPDVKSRSVDVFLANVFKSIEEAGAGILFLDEINRPSSDRLLNLLMSLIPYGTIGGRRIEAFFYIIGAANPIVKIEDRRFISVFEGAISDRFAIYMFQPTREEINKIIEDIFPAVFSKLVLELAEFVYHPAVQPVSFRMLDELKTEIQSFVLSKNEKSVEFLKAKVISILNRHLNEVISVLDTNYMDSNIYLEPVADDGKSFVKSVFHRVLMRLIEVIDVLGESESIAKTVKMISNSAKSSKNFSQSVSDILESLKKREGNFLNFVKTVPDSKVVGAVAKLVFVDAEELKNAKFDNYEKLALNMYLDEVVSVLRERLRKIEEMGEELIALVNRSISDVRERVGSVSSSPLD